MAADEIHKGDIGTILEATIKDQDSAVVDISAASTKTIKLMKPDGTVESKVGAFVTDGTDGKMKYVTISGDLDTVGSWRIQGYVVLSSGEWHSDKDEFTVHSNLE